MIKFMIRLSMIYALMLTMLCGLGMCRAFDGYYGAYDCEKVDASWTYFSVVLIAFLYIFVIYASNGFSTSDESFQRLGRFRKALVLALVVPSTVYCILGWLILAVALAFSFLIFGALFCGVFGVSFAILGSGGGVAGSSSKAKPDNGQKDRFFSCGRHYSAHDKYLGESTRDGNNIIHYNAEKVKTGESRMAGGGATVDYDSFGRCIGTSVQVGSHIDHYDANGIKVSGSQIELNGKVVHSDRYGNKTGETR